MGFRIEPYVPNREGAKIFLGLKTVKKKIKKAAKHINKQFLHMEGSKLYFFLFLFCTLKLKKWENVTIVSGTACVDTPRG